MSLENFMPVPALIERATEQFAEVNSLEIPEVSAGESLFADTERVSNLIHNLGGVTLSETIELRPDTGEFNDDIESIAQDTDSDETDIEEEIEDETEEPEEDKPKQQKKQQKSRPYSMYDGSETRSAALDFIYIATAIPVDEIAA